MIEFYALALIAISVLGFLYITGNLLITYSGRISSPLSSFKNLSAFQKGLTSVTDGNSKENQA